MRDPRNPSGETRIDTRIPDPATKVGVNSGPGKAAEINTRTGTQNTPDPSMSVTEPTLMPFQETKFNADTFVAEEFLKLKEKFKVEVAIELGSAVGGTTKWLGENFDEVHTIEIMENFLEFTKKRCIGLSNISFHLGSTVDKLAGVLSVSVPEGSNDSVLGSNMLIFIDSHWNTLPIFDELKIIKASGLKPVIVIHDFLVPGEPKLGYDSYEGVDISFENIKKFIDDIYGEEGYEYHYNSDATSTEIKRGLIYIYPKK